MKGFTIDAVIDFANNLDYIELAAFIKERSGVHDHVLNKLLSKSKKQGYMNYQAIFEWLTELDSHHRNIVQSYIIGTLESLK